MNDSEDDSISSNKVNSVWKIRDDEEEKQVIEEFNKIMDLNPITPFKSLKWDDHLKSSHGFHLNCDRIEDTGSRMKPTFIPMLELISPSCELVGFLNEFKETHINDCEASARIVIDAILREAMKLTGNTNLSTENSIHFHSKEKSTSYKGIDTLGSDKEPTCCLLAIEAKREILRMNTLFENYEQAIRQAIGYAASLAHLRKKSFTLLKVPVFGAISTGFSWYFFAVDDDVVYSGGPEIYIENDLKKKFGNSKGLQKVLQWLVWILKTMRSPRSCLQDLNQQKENLKEIRKCFK